MTLSFENVKHIAKLCKIKIDETELEAMDTKLNGIMDWIDKLSEVSLEDAPNHAVSPYLVLEREDNHPTPDQHTKILSNAPRKNHDYFVVPKVVEDA